MKSLLFVRVLILLCYCPLYICIFPLYGFYFCRAAMVDTLHSGSLRRQKEYIFIWVLNFFSAWITHELVVITAQHLDTSSMSAVIQLYYLMDRISHTIVLISWTVKIAKETRLERADNSDKTGRYLSAWFSIHIDPLQVDNNSRLLTGSVPLFSWESTAYPCSHQTAHVISYNSRVSYSHEVTCCYS